MLKYFRERRAKRQEAREAFDAGAAFADAQWEQLQSYLAANITPRRKAFIEVFRDRLALIDENGLQSPIEERLSRMDYARIEYQILLDNWADRQVILSTEVASALSEQLKVADRVGVREQYEMAIKEALNQQHMTLVSEGLELLLEVASQTPTFGDTDA